MSYESAYVRGARESAIEAYDREMELRAFRKNFQPAIRHGMSEAELKRQYHCRQRDIELFREVKAEVDKEERLGQAFLEGFNNPNFMESRMGR